MKTTRLEPKICLTQIGLLMEGVDSVTQGERSGAYSGDNLILKRY